MKEKLGVAYLLKYLYENTDMDHPTNTGELRNVLRENGYQSDRRTIRKHADILLEAGFDIVINEQKGIPTEYSYGARDWDVTDLRILIDAVSSAPFLTKSKTDQLIARLSVQAGKQHRDELVPEVCVSEHIKAENDQLMYIIEKITLAIQSGKKISFRMYNYNTNKRRVFRHGGEVYVLSPYNTIWKDDRYYVVGWSDKREAVVSMRIDRMGLPDQLEDDAVPPPEDYNVQDYTDTITRMYPGAMQQVTLRCQLHMIDHVIDKFGKSVEIFNVTASSFDVTVSIAVSGTFLSWVFEYAGEMIILSPDPVRKMYAEMLRTTANEMAEGRFEKLGERTWKL